MNVLYATMFYTSIYFCLKFCIICILRN